VRKYDEKTKFILIVFYKLRSKNITEPRVPTFLHTIGAVKCLN